MITKPFRHEFRAMGGPNHILCHHSDDSLVAKAFLAVETEIKRIESKYSRYQSDTVISKANQLAGNEAVDIDEETEGLLTFASTCFEQSDGLFDITSGILRKVWRFDEGLIPDKQSIERLLPLIGFEKLEWGDGKLFLPREGMEIDFGGIGKEYAADRAGAVVRELGIKNALINLSGDVVVTGPQADGSAWNVGIAHPREKGQVLTFVKVFSGAVASSGDYERFFEADGKRFCHILNPKTGYPVEKLQGVTVLAETCSLAGAASSIAMLLERDGEKFLADLGLPFCVVKETGKIRMNGAFKRGSSPTEES